MASCSNYPYSVCPVGARGLGNVYVLVPGEPMEKLGVVKVWASLSFLSDAAIPDPERYVCDHALDRARVKYPGYYLIAYVVHAEEVNEWHGEREPAYVYEVVIRGFLGHVQYNRCPRCGGVGSTGRFVDYQTLKGRKARKIVSQTCSTCNGKGCIAPTGEPVIDGNPEAPEPQGVIHANQPTVPCP